MAYVFWGSLERVVALVWPLAKTYQPHWRWGPHFPPPRTPSPISQRGGTTIMTSGEDVYCMAIALCRRGLLVLGCSRPKCALQWP